MSNQEQLEKRRKEKYTAKLHEFKEANKKKLCVANIFSTVITIGCAIATLVILKSDYPTCKETNLNTTLWLMFGMHIINALEGACGLIGLDKIFCGCICVIGFFVYEVAVLFYMQWILYSSTACAS